jgi:glutathione S-transferase
VLLNPTGELPVLADRGAVFTQASYICEYLEDAYPDAPRLLPGDPLGNWQVRFWQKYVDDYIAAAVSDLAWDALGDRRLAAQGAASAPTIERRMVWLEHSHAFSDDRLAMAREYVTQAAGMLEQALGKGPWLAGEGFSLADIAMASWLAYLPGLMPDALGGAALDWLERALARPAMRTALGKGAAGDPFALAAPGPEATRWG